MSQAALGRHINGTKRYQRSRQRTCFVPAFSVLELIIALALLATLMMVAWSILASYRVAEQRGWDQTYRLRVMSVARTWLVNDAAHLMNSDSWERQDLAAASTTSSPAVSLPIENVFASEPTASNTNQTVFRGTSQELVWQQIPSVDPLPWLDQVTASWQPLRSTTQTLDGSTQAGTAGAESRARSPRIDPLEISTVSYRFVIDGVTAKQQPVYRLQRELRASAAWGNRQENQQTSADQLLTTADLYRVNEPAAATAVTGALVTSSAIRYLVSPKFRFCDGEQWVDQWDSRLQMRLPTAIELSFDFPPASSPYQVARQQPDDQILSDTLLADELAENSQVDGLQQSLSTTIDAAETATQTQGGGQVELRDVRIVVRIPAHSSLPQAGSGQ